jgi:hypothetical protein
MKVDVFKKLIKEAVREVLREELSQVKPTPIQENKTMSFTTQDVDMIAYRQNLAASMGLNIPTQPIHSKSQSAPSGNPYLDIIAETAANMTPQDLAAMRQYNE